MSIGVAAIERGGVVKEAGHLVKATDMALYAAKNAGRNCVRVFTGQGAAAPLRKPAA